jgi:excisionase family DNA binding protein
VSDEELLTVQQVSERLKVSPFTVRRWLREGRIKGVLMGGRRSGYRISEAEVRRIATQGIPPDTPKAEAA